jgi:hypothetical protein
MKPSPNTIDYSDPNAPRQYADAVILSTKAGFFTPAMPVEGVSIMDLTFPQI